MAETLWTTKTPIVQTPLMPFKHEIVDSSVVKLKSFLTFALAEKHWKTLMTKDDDREFVRAVPMSVARTMNQKQMLK
jgi:hypothetical protein